MKRSTMDAGPKRSTMALQRDIRDFIFQRVGERRYRAAIIAGESGILSGTGYLQQASAALGIITVKCRKDGTRVKTSDVIVVVEGSAKEITSAEEQFLGWISKASGIATAAAKARAAVGKRLRVVSGAWKKMPPPIKDLVRQAVLDGGLQFRISEPPFIYLDKNYVKILGGVEKALRSADESKGMTTVIQLKSEGQTLLAESLLAANMGADIVMIDTGRKEDIEKVDRALRKERLRDRVKIAFGGGVRIEDLTDLRKKPVEIIDIGRAIVDAPLLDMRMDVLKKP